MRLQLRYHAPQTSTNVEVRKKCREHAYFRAFVEFRNRHSE